MSSRVHNNSQSAIHWGYEAYKQLWLVLPFVPYFCPKHVIQHFPRKCWLTEDMLLLHLNTIPRHLCWLIGWITSTVILNIVCTSHKSHQCNESCTYGSFRNLAEGWFGLGLQSSHEFIASTGIFRDVVPLGAAQAWQKGTSLHTLASFHVALRRGEDEEVMKRSLPPTARVRRAFFRYWSRAVLVSGHPPRQAR